MDSITKKVEAIKASIESHKAYITLWQVKILSRIDDNKGSFEVLERHVNLIRDYVEEIKEILCEGEEYDL